MNIPTAAKTGTPNARAPSDLVADLFRLEADPASRPQRVEPRETTCRGCS